MTDDDTFFGIKAINYKDWAEKAKDFSKIDLMQALLEARQRLEKEIENKQLKEENERLKNERNGN